MKEIKIPINGVVTSVLSEQSFVIVGANGSGKSRLGAWIEKLDNDYVLRISAQRALSVPDYVTVRNEKTAWNVILYGNDKNLDKGYKWSWGNETTKLVNDYNSVLEAVFARIANEKDTYFNKCRQCEKQGVNKPQTPQIIEDKIIDIWNSVFPHRSIVLYDNTIKAITDEDKQQYLAKQMSDGERVAIYLIGQCLVAPENVTIIIDEPEIHLHRTIIHKLWDKIEEYCPENTFVYITHDLDFAASRKTAKKIWVKSFDKDNGTDKWDIQILDENGIIPDDLMLEVLGNRKNVLLVEGEKGSYDTQLYSFVYDDLYVIPCHNCYKVIELTKAFNEENVKGLHSVSVQGVIDRDYLSETEIEAYRNRGIFTLDVAEVENLYLLPEIQRIVAEHMALDNIEKILEQVKVFLFDEFEKEKDVQISSICERDLQYKLSRFHKEGNGVDLLKRHFNDLIDSIDIDKMYQIVEEKVNRIIEDRDLYELLKIYNRKSLHKRVSKFFNLTNNDYPELVLRLMKTDKKEVIVNALRKHLPQI